MQEEEILYDDIELSEVQDDITIEEVVQAIDVTDATSFDIEVSEAFPASGEIDVYNHALLYNREISDAHPITAITGLREELDSIEALQTVYSDKKGNADYYEWADGHALGENGVGYFVTLNKDCRTISICSGDDIFGVVVETAAFVGGQDDITRDAHYGLVATSGAVHVRCELDVAEDDYVISNAYGIATKASSEHGYKVVALHDINGVPHAMINLNISADQVHLMGAELQDLGGRMDAAESNIVSAVNVANEAYNKSSESVEVSEEAVKKALEAVLRAEGAEDTVKDMEETLTSVSNTSAQARAIAESAATSAMSIRDEAVKRTDEDWKSASDVTKTLEPIAIWKDDETGISGADYLANVMEEGIATTYDIKTVDTKTDKAMSAIKRNGKELHSLMTVIDKYSVGEYSQAYGLTLDEAQSILEVGMMYVPTSHEKLEAKTKYHTEEYKNNDNAPTSPRTFVPGYLYQWGKNGEYYGWITVDKHNDPIDYDETSEENRTNTAGCAVYFASQMIPDVVGNPQYGYWYTDGDTSTGTASDYESYTLYKWEKPEGEKGYWFAIATLAGNSSNRAVSQIRQDANSIELSVAALDDKYAGTKIWVDDNKSAVQDVVSWKGDNAEAIATTIQSASDSEAYIAQIASVKNDDGTINAMASIVTAINGQTGDSIIKLSADVVDISASDFSLKGQTINISADDVLGIESPYFSVNTDGYITATGGTIGGWSIKGDVLYNAISSESVDPWFTGLNASSYTAPSLIEGNDQSYIRIFAGSKLYNGSYTNDEDRPKFLVLQDGSLYAGAAEITGAITATTGHFGQCYIDEGGVIYSDGSEDTYIKMQNGEIECKSIEWSNASIPHQTAVLTSGSMKFNYITTYNDATTTWVNEHEFGTSSAAFGWVKPDFTAANMAPPRFLIESNCIDLHVYQDANRTGQGRLLGDWYCQISDTDFSKIATQSDIKALSDRIAALGG